MRAAGRAFLALLIGAIAVAACRHGASLPSAATDSPPDSAFVLPGAFSEQTSVADLEALFGKSNVTIADVPNAVTGTSRGIVLFPDDPTRRAYVNFYEEEPLQHLSSITVKDAGSRWRGKLGVQIGTSFAALRERNGAEFWFYGFDDQDEASVRDTWNAGALDVTEGDVALLRRRPAPARRRGSDARVPRGYDQFSSDDPRYPALGESVEVSAITAWSSLDDE